MHKVKLLFYLGLMGLVSCKHEPTNAPITLKANASSCAEGDTIVLKLFSNEMPYSQNVVWNSIHIVPSQKNYLFIAPKINTDTSSFTAKAVINEQTIMHSISVWKAAFKKPVISYAQTIQPLLNNNCNFTGCHGNGSRAGKVELSKYDSVKQFVAPYNAASSLLYIALMKPDPLRVMPPAGKLHDYLIEDVRLWIEQGAHNN